jgi:enoyl-CoA hydratase
VVSDQREFVRVENDGAVGVIRLDRPPMNALSRQVQEELKSAALEVSSRDDIRSVIVYGGPKIFAAGADVKEMAAWSYQDALAQTSALQDAFSAVARIPKPTIAAVTGYALGGGCELALCCDIRVAGDNAKLGQPEILLGVIPGAGGTQRHRSVRGCGRSTAYRPGRLRRCARRRIHRGNVARTAALPRCTDRDACREGRHRQRH